MTNVVLLGGNGYIGRNVTESWMKKDSSAVFYVVSRSGKNDLNDDRIKNIAADVTNYEEVASKLPEKIDYIVDFVGRPESDDEAFKQVNDKPAEVMLQIAKANQVKAMGFIGDLLGPKKFLEGKKRIAEKLRVSGIRTEIVEPTVVYGNGRSDALAKMIPIFKCLGIFIKNMKPVQVSDVADELVSKMVK
ncbi:NAD-dependent epimerase/dehydratase family protein [Gemella cuniculi]|uniref:NAD-dependent epimerase/dehydratase family protein n=1 Tax=Gemella cuniculi TaxID=150240 RepID=UPI0003F9E581|nr:NAD-dependent epimerase/dehydratase family protein [Gemella cuniculi]